MWQSSAPQTLSDGSKVTYDPSAKSPVLRLTSSPQFINKTPYGLTPKRSLRLEGRITCTSCNVAHAVDSIPIEATTGSYVLQDNEANSSFLYDRWRSASRLSIADTNLLAMAKKDLFTPPVSSDFGGSLSCVAVEVSGEMLGAHETAVSNICYKCNTSRIMRREVNVQQYWPNEQILNTSIGGAKQAACGAMWDKENNPNGHPHVSKTNYKRNSPFNVVCGRSINTLLMSPIFFTDDVTVNDRYCTCNDSYNETNPQGGNSDLKAVACCTECTSKALILNNSNLCEYGNDVTRSALLTKKRRCSEMECNEAPVSLSSKSGVTSTFDSVSKSSVQCSIAKWHSSTEVTIESALNRSDLDFIGDFTRSYCLPTVHNSKHFDLKSISCETLSQMLQNDMSGVVHKYIIVDCRYPYEFMGGHIQDAVNVYSKEDIITRFIKSSEFHQFRSGLSQRPLLVFHCEFSSQRGPRLMHFLRNKDRESHVDCYPSLYYPEMYLLDGGYKAFFECYPNLCIPSCYQPMMSDDHVEELRYFRAKSKSWAGHHQLNSIRNLAVKARSNQNSSCSS